MDDTLFQKACAKVLEQERMRKGIGTLGEKTLHAVLKYFYEPDDGYHEVRVGSYVADIMRDGEIIEVQTAGFGKMREKLASYLKDYHVTIVYPIAHTKWLVWLDEQTGEVTKRRKSPKTGSVYDAFRELYRIKFLLKNPKLHFCFPLIDLEEQRILDGWSKDRKKGSHRYDRIPIALENEIYVDGIKEFGKLIPETLQEPFTTKDFAKEAKITINRAQTAVNVLYYTGTLQRVGKQKNAYLYERKKEQA